MAQEALQQLACVLSVLLGSGSLAQDAEVLRTPEGEPFSATCQYRPSQQSMLKIWCRRTRADDPCSIVVDSSQRESQVLRSTLTIYPLSNRFTVTMRELRVKDSGFYSCVVWDPYLRSFTILGTIHLVVFKAPPKRARMTTAPARMTTAPASATSPVFESPPRTAPWKFMVAAVLGTGLLLLGAAVAVALCLKRRRERAQNGRKNPHHVYDDIAVQKEEPPGSDQQTIISGEDVGTVCYASIVHPSPLAFQDSIYANTDPAWKRTPDGAASVEYASIASTRHQLSPPAAPVEGAGDHRPRSPGSRQFPGGH